MALNHSCEKGRRRVCCKHGSIVPGTNLRREGRSILIRPERRYRIDYLQNFHFYEKYFGESS